MSDEFHEHEALHTAHVILDTWDNHVRNHPYVDADPELVELADKASDAMMALYRAIGAKSHKEEK